MRVPEATAVVDLQFGSTGKGSIAAWLGEYGDYDAVATAWGPNAGHTSVYDDGAVCVRTMLSNAAFRSPSIKTVFIGPGSVVNPQNLRMEYADTLARGNVNLMLVIHESAAVVCEVDRQAEGEYGFVIGSTMKGTAEAMIRKIKRQPTGHNPPTMGEFARIFPKNEISQLVVSHSKYLKLLYGCKNVLLEGAQGYSLGMNSGFYPHCTSRECTVAQLLSDTLMPIHSIEHVIGVARTFPIRVANRFKDGKQVGTSGPVYDDQQEIEWSSIGIEPELTTVTKLPRRVFTFSTRQIEEAVTRNSVSSIFMNFMNYIPAKADQDAFLNKVDTVLPAGCGIDFLGYGPSIADIEALVYWAEMQKAAEAVGEEA